eukprot:scpid82301/ scgid15922/ 
MDRFVILKSRVAFEALTNPTAFSEGKRRIHAMKVNDFKVNTHTVVSRPYFWILAPFVHLAEDQFNREARLDKVTVLVTGFFDDLKGSLACTASVPEDGDITEARVAVTVEKAQEIVNLLDQVPVENQTQKRRVDLCLTKIQEELCAPEPSVTKMVNVFRILLAIWELLMLATSHGHDMWNAELMRMYHDFLLPAWVYDFTDEKTVSEVYVVISTPVGYNAARNPVDEAALLLSTPAGAPTASFNLEACLDSSKPRMAGAVLMQPNTSYFQVQKMDKDAIANACTKKVNTKGIPYVMGR